MQRNTVRRTLGIAGVLALGNIAIAYAQQQPAPPAAGGSTPPAATAATAPVTPVTGHWPDADCAATKLTTTASEPRCRVGPMFNDTVRTSANAGSGQECFGEQWSVATRSPSNFGFALLANIRTPVPRCEVRYRDIAAALKDSTVARNGTGWSDVNQIGGIYIASFTAAGGQTAAFTSVGGENCKAFLKLGPPWAGGSLWIVHGWLCGVPGNSVRDRDLQSFVDALIVKVP
jgi:hypothetical protein